jgi:hypothetical protein
MRRSTEAIALNGVRRRRWFFVSTVTARLRPEEVAGALAVIALRRPLCQSLAIPAQTSLALALVKRPRNSMPRPPGLSFGTALRAAATQAIRR